MVGGGGTSQSILCCTTLPSALSQGFSFSMVMMYVSNLVIGGLVAGFVASLMVRFWLFRR
jgi:hypothetical protein